MLNYSGEERRKKENKEDRDRFSKHLTVVLRAIELREKKKREEQEEKDQKKSISLLDW
jgi:hypothetical protein